MIIRAILPDWAKAKRPDLRKVQEGKFSKERIEQLNSDNYNIYFLPNYPAIYNDKKIVDGSDIDTFQYVFVDLDMKDYNNKDADRAHSYKQKDDFLLALLQSPIPPTIINDSGNGIHAYWEVSDLDAMSYLKLQRRLARHFHTDPEVSKIYQLMRLPGTLNTKTPDAPKQALRVYQDSLSYTSEALDAALPPITTDDEEYCKDHFDKTYSTPQDQAAVQDRLPTKFGSLLLSNQEVKDIWVGNTDDRSKGDYRLGHIMLASGFTKDEAASVLINTAKALSRAPKHRVNYAMNIIDKIWTFETAPQDEVELTLSSSVRDILSRTDKTALGTRFPCYSYFDNTAYGFRLGQIIGLVAGSGVGKTAVALNMFRGFVEHNPDYDHFFVPLEQPSQEIAERWQAMCEDNVHLHDKVHIINNYDEKTGFRHLSLAEIQDYIVKFQKKTGKKIGAVVIDHIGALKLRDKDNKKIELQELCQQMKSFAINTNTMLIMQSQTSREKASIGDLELNKDAAYGTVFFESYCDYLITLWQPLKRCYEDPQCPTVTAFKFCKIRHKKQTKDAIQEDVRYALMFDPNTDRLREMTQMEEKSFDFFNKQAANLRSKDRKTDVLSYKSVKFVDETKIIS